jgi:hypothetical protein
VSKQRIILGQAWRIAERIKEHLAPHCELIEMAGSVRRRQQEVGDIEFVLIPRIRENLLGEPDGGGTDLDAQLRADVRDGRLHPPILDGEKQKRFELVGRGGLTLELFIVDPVRWGVAMAIRTGPALFSKALVTERSRGGLLPEGHAVHDLRVWARCTRDGDGEVLGVAEPLPTPREEDVLRITCGRWVEPWKRTLRELGDLRARLTPRCQGVSHAT